jgi:hypothetical protein
LGVRRKDPEQVRDSDMSSPQTHRDPLFTNDRGVVVAAVEAASPELPMAQVNKVVTALDEELTLRGYSDSMRDNYRRGQETTDGGLLGGVARGRGYRVEGERHPVGSGLDPC